MQGRFVLAETSWPGQTLWPFLGTAGRGTETQTDPSGQWSPTYPSKIWRNVSSRTAGMRATPSKPTNTDCGLSSPWTYSSSSTVWPTFTSWAWPSWILSRWWMRSSRRWLSFPFVSSWHWPLSRMLGRTSGGTRLINSSTICPASYSAGKQITTVDLKLIITSIVKMITVGYNMWPRTTKPVIFFLIE